MNGGDEGELPDIDCLVIGGVADGVLMRIKFDATVLELGAPTHAKPLESPLQKEPEMALKTDIYNIFKIYWPTITGQQYPMSIAIIDGQAPAWAAKQLSVAYVQYSTQRLLKEAKGETKQ